MADAVHKGQRFTEERPCPICGGWDKMPRGKGLRCFGYIGHDHKFAHCSREDHAGGLTAEAGGTFAHKLEGDCRCGARHSDPPVTHIDEARSRHGDDRVVNEIVYDYEGGLRVVRRELANGDKTFVQYHKNGAGYVPGRGEAPLTLYRAPELRSAPRDAFVFLVEGEKCVDNLRMHELVATTTPGGAKQWKGAADRAAEILRNRHVVILPDNDEPGRGYAAAAQETLTKVVSSLRVLDLPGLDKSEDVVDWMKHGGEPEDLVRMAELRPDLAAVHRIPVASVAAIKLWSQPLPPAIPTGLVGLDRIIGGLRAESFVVVNAPPGRGKTGFAIQVTLGVVKQGVPGVLLTSELSVRQAIARSVAQLRRVPWLRVFELGPSEADSIAFDLEGLPLRVVQLRKGMVIRDILNRVADEDGRAPTFTLDYLQHAARRLAIEDRRLAVGALIDEVGTWACDNRSSGLVVSSVSRGMYRPDDDATAEDFLGAGKEAGEIECDASAELYLAAELPPEGGSAPAKLHVSKHRFGPSGQTVGLIFDGAIGMFRDDPQAALTESQSEILAAITDGCRSAADYIEKHGGKKQRVLKDFQVLRRQGLIDGPPYVVKERS